MRDLVNDVAVALRRLGFYGVLAYGGFSINLHGISDQGGLSNMVEPF